MVSEISGSRFVRNGRKQCKVWASAREWIDRGRFSNVVAIEEAVGRTLLYLSFPLAGEQEAFKDWLLELKGTQQQCSKIPAASLCICGQSSDIEEVWLARAFICLSISLLSSHMCWIQMSEGRGRDCGKAHCISLFWFSLIQCHLSSNSFSGILYSFRLLRFLIKCTLGRSLIFVL